MLGVEALLRGRHGGSVTRFLGTLSAIGAPFSSTGPGAAAIVPALASLVAPALALSEKSAKAFLGALSASGTRRRASVSYTHLTLPTKA